MLCKKLGVKEGRGPLLEVGVFVETYSEINKNL